MSIKDRYSELPVSCVAEEIVAALDGSPRIIVTAPPGAGKSTLLPLLLLERFHSGKILMLEPRRIAARQVAERMAFMLGERVGETVGYRVRFDSKVSNDTRIEVITEGILERILIDDPTLGGVQTVVFDEFHERSLSSDLCLALVRDIQDIIRPDLRIIVMSATIDTAQLARSLNAEVIHSEGRSFDVEVIHCHDIEIGEISLETARCVIKAFKTCKGNILAFLPGQAEIMRCRELLEGNINGVEILTLFGMMSPEEQHRVLAPSEKGTRRIVLASPIAETSLTIDGISVVVDSGFHRIPVFDPATGLSPLSTVRISMDMADQRAGRAGRLMPGTCFRLWSKATEAKMKEFREPEILSADLSSMLLAVSAYGETRPLRLPWITPPPDGHLANATGLLRLLSALDSAGQLTERGRRILRLPCHPRIASMLNEAGRNGSLACDIAAILEEKDPCPGEADADLTTRVEELSRNRKGKISSQWRRINDIAAQYRRLIKVSEPPKNIVYEEIGRLLATAYPERIAMSDGRGRYRLASGGSYVALHPDDPLSCHEFIAVASMGRKIYLAAPVDREWVESKGEWREVALWNGKEGRAVVGEELRLGLLTLASRPGKGNHRDSIVSVIAAAAPKEGLSMFDFNEDVKTLQQRILVASQWHPELNFPDVSTDALLASASEWLPLYIGKATTAQELRKIDMKAVILGLLDYGRQQALERIVPERIKLPAGRSVRVNYRQGASAPVVSARLQDCFGMTATPRVDEGRRPVLMELLSPGFKPVQLTQDMEGFWKETYFEVRKELRRRYPKHSWPENPNSIN